MKGMNGMPNVHGPCQYPYCYRPPMYNTYGKYPYPYRADSPANNQSFSDEKGSISDFISTLEEKGVIVQEGKLE